MQPHRAAQLRAPGLSSAGCSRRLPLQRAPVCHRWAAPQGLGLRGRERGTAPRRRSFPRSCGRCTMGCGSSATDSGCGRRGSDRAATGSWGRGSRGRGGRRGSDLPPRDVAGGLLRRHRHPRGPHRDLQRRRRPCSAPRHLTVPSSPRRQRRRRRRRRRRHLVTDPVPVGGNGPGGHLWPAGRRRRRLRRRRGGRRGGHR